jgi:hypothetical protein
MDTTYIGSNVPEVDGTYIAQNNGTTTGGQIATCATAAGPVAANCALYPNCNDKLMVNSAFVANDVVLEQYS